MNPEPVDGLTRGLRGYGTKLERGARTAPGRGLSERLRMSKVRGVRKSLIMDR
jgi:hypothetical protein